ECDNDATGSAAFPRTQPVFSNITNIGPKRNGTVTLPAGEKFERAIYLRRNSAVSIFNSIHTSWEKGIYIKDAGTVDNFTTNDSAVFGNNLLLADMSPKVITLDANNSLSFYSTIFTGDNNDSTNTTAQVAWVNAFPANLNSTPDYRLQAGSTAATGASFTDPKFNGQLIGVEENEAALSNVALFPNPAKEAISIAINLNHSSDVIVNIYDITGKLIAQPLNENMSSGRSIVKFDASTISAGLYFATIQVDGTSKTVKFVVAK
ncbi:MAG: T9SS type A sorting domain-containing protein, partial [Bacteroidia bacterium]|nr:T9SS type A sorting domain-containing protein [Bacteroidia bacterium]